MDIKETMPRIIFIITYMGELLGISLTSFTPAGITRLLIF